MDSKAVYRETEKCKQLLENPRLRDVEKMYVTAYLKSLEREKNE
jgi:hypothetical protein